MTKHKLGNLFVVSGPSGVGKGTVIAKVLQNVPNIEKSISATTRSPRPSELNGKDYFFISAEQFDQMVRLSEFLEWAKFADNFYGTPHAWVHDKLNQGIDVILEIEIQGAKQVHSLCPYATLIFLSPPSLAVLEQRLRTRATESPDKLALRLNKAKEEMGEKNIFQYEVINDNLEEAVKNLADIVYAKRVNDNLQEESIRKAL